MTKNTKLILEALDIAVRHYCHIVGYLNDVVEPKNADKMLTKAWEFEGVADAISNGTIKVEEVENESLHRH